MVFLSRHADVEAIVCHIERRIGRVHRVFQEIVSDDLHIDVYHVKSSLFRRYEVLVTSGMSAVPMAVPEGEGVPRFAEIVTVLPKGWPLTQDAFLDERHYWPIRLMKDVARLPYYSKTWVGFGHTFSNGSSEADIRPYADSTALCSVAILPPASLGESAWLLKRNGEDDIAFWAAVPLHLAELKFKFENGMDALLDLFDQNGVTDRIDPERPSVV